MLGLDLLFVRDGRRHGVEVKFSEAPSPTRSMRSSIADLSLDQLWVIYPGEHSYPVERNITVWPLRDVAALPEALAGSRRLTRR